MHRFPHTAQSPRTPVAERRTATMLYDANAFAVEPVAAALFDRARWQADAGSRDASGGRGGAMHVRGEFGDAVLRHYRRGGFVARLSDDRYFYAGADRTRPFREFRVLARAHGAGLPVPAPIAAAFRREGLAYRGDILVAAVPDARTLAQLVAANDPVDWAAVGAAIAQCHRAGFFHADLNAHNVLLDAHGSAWLIDFDRARLRTPAPGWQQSNLARLQRSLRKVGAASEPSFATRDWPALTAAHAAAVGGTR
jgi:3-deoxy-D-manno-octulosonic acid kinase